MHGIKTAIASLLTLGLVAATPASGQETLRVGFPAPLTGFVAEAAKDMVNGFKLYLEQNGNKLGGMPVELIVEDTAANPQNALTKMRKLVENDKADFVVGYLLAFEGYAVREYVIQNKVPLFLPIVSADDLTQRLRNQYIVRPSWSSSQFDHPLADYAYKKLGYRKIAMLGLDYAWGWENAGGFQRVFEDLGGKVVQKIWVPLNAADHGPYVSQIKPDVDAVYAVMVGAHVPKLIKSFNDFGLKSKLPLIGPGTITDEDSLRNMGAESVGVLTAANYVNTLTRPQNKAFVAAFTAKYKKSPSTFAETTYTTAMWLDQALKKSGRPTGDKTAFLNAFKSMKVEAPRGPVSLDAYNNAIETIYIRKVVKSKAGAGYENEVIESISNVSQFWTYDPKKFLEQPVYNRDNPPCKNC